MHNNKASLTREWVEERRGRARSEERVNRGEGGVKSGGGGGESNISVQKLAYLIYVAVRVRVC